jgi:predicted nucleic acid-binding protein
VIVERGSDQAAELWNSVYPVASSILAYPEGRAALAAAKRAGRLGGAKYDQAVADFESRFSDLISVGVDFELAQVAGAQAEAFGLRGYDAVHLASALALEGEATLVTWDEDLADAAVSAGVAVAGGASE